VVGEDVVCVAVEGVFLDEPDLGALRITAVRAEERGMDAVFLRDGPLGDAIVLAAGLSSASGAVLLGVRVRLSTQPHRHPTVLAREMTTLDHVCNGRSVLAFRGPFTAAVAEAIALCRDMWRNGVAASDGPYYPVAGAINRPRPRRSGVALDLTDGAVAAPSLLAACDLVLVPAGAAPPASLPPGTEVCQILVA
jgi:alkanesulfonate monooxygenase SsuD/methylene tetrahydromethanopterin reductase-like flavin-dependent oxidoreductase (luciferase family)